MDAVKFFKETKRMCDSIRVVGGFIGRCDECEIDRRKAPRQTCDTYIKQNPEEAVAIVEKWSMEHPRETRQNKFLKRFPKATIAPDGILRIDPCDIDSSMRQSRICTESESCYDCRKSFWLAKEDKDDGN